MKFNKNPRIFFEQKESGRGIEHTQLKNQKYKIFTWIFSLMEYKSMRKFINIITLVRSTNKILELTLLSTSQRTASKRFIECKNPLKHKICLPWLFILTLYHLHSFIRRQARYNVRRPLVPRIFYLTRDINIILYPRHKSLWKNYGLICFFVSVMENIILL